MARLEKTPGPCHSSVGRLSGGTGARERRLWGDRKVLSYPRSRYAKVGGQLAYAGICLAGLAAARLTENFRIRHSLDLLNGQIMLCIIGKK
jgi:hypothetical protein